MSASIERKKRPFHFPDSAFTTDPGIAPNLLSFFPVINKDPGPGVRRPLTLKTPRARLKPLTSGRTNPLPAPEKSGSSERMRRLRPINIAKARIPARSRTVVATPGVRETRDEALTVEDLWRPGVGPPALECHPDDRCGLCLHLLSHPVLIWLEWQWDCPECDRKMTTAPFRNLAAETFIQRIYGDWDQSTVTYEWGGLTFPVIPTA
ncbi:hypothetical protein C8F04DRAFT_1198118 [Mycena alexandri]|uniref:Uncharacterized protein n=1 Tax=Mycena alexandri TaxID=1745969 RepID=A0AAD6S2G2_9AGAR|nr:hypothetical protein C8F04DRAFT_1198118 [Mycena alexandri]